VRLAPVAAGAMESRGYPSTPLEPEKPQRADSKQWHQLIVETTGAKASITVDGQRTGTYDLQLRAGSVLIDVAAGAIDIRNMTVTRTDPSDTVRAFDKPHEQDYFPPKLELDVKPDYSEGAMSRGIEGRVDLHATVLGDGTVGSVRIRKWLDPELEHAALAAVRQWRFRPATRNGVPIPSIVEIEMTFTRR
jgi:TonB family protein